MRNLVTLIAVLTALVAQATPSTLVTIPSTDIQPVRMWHLGADSTVFAGGSAASPAAFVDVGLTYGLTPRLEAGFDIVSGQDNPLWGNIKYQLLSPEQSPVILAAGIYNANTSTATNQQILYLVGSIRVSAARVTLGAYNGRASALGGDKSGVLAGLDYTQGKWWYGIDFASGKNTIGSWNVGIGYALTEKIGVIVGYDNYTTPGARDGFNIQFDTNL